MTIPPLQDERAALFEQHRDRLLALAYRMLGSASEARDIVQEASIRWLETDDDIRSPEGYLIKIVTHLSIDHLRSARRQRETYVGQWLPEPVETSQSASPSYQAELADSLSMAFLRLLETLSPLERAVFLLREVFSLSYSTIADLTGKTEAHCRQIARRARGRINTGRPRFDATPEERDRLLHHFQDAVQSGNLERLQAMLAEDVVLYADSGGKATAPSRPVHGVTKVSHFILGVSRKPDVQRLQWRRAEVNGEPSFVFGEDGQPQGTLSIHVEAGRIQSIFIVVNPDKLDALQHQTL